MNEIYISKKKGFKAWILYFKSCYIFFEFIRIQLIFTNRKLRAKNMENFLLTL